MDQKKIESNMWVTPAARYAWSFKLYVQSSMPPTTSFDKLREADSPAKAFCQLCVCEMQVKTHLVTFAAIVIEESISQTSGILMGPQLLYGSCSRGIYVFSFMLLLNNTEGCCQYLPEPG